VEISALVERAEDLGRRLQAAGLPAVLCHADAHTANVLIDSADNLWVVDWDETVLAPKERDLMFVMGGGISTDLVGPREEAWFFQGYGDAPVDPLALAYYRYAWSVQDIGSFGEQVFFTPEAGVETRRDAMRIFMRLFQPGQIVRLAFATPLPA
jgi:spectinomycin phosphotransferase